MSFNVLHPEEDLVQVLSWYTGPDLVPQQPIASYTPEDVLYDSILRYPSLSNTALYCSS